MQVFTELKTENYQLLVMSNNINKNIENLAILNNTQLEILNKNNQKLIENIVDLVNKIEQQNNINQIQITEQNSISKDSFIKKFINR